MTKSKSKLNHCSKVNCRKCFMAAKEKDFDSSKKVSKYCGAKPMENLVTSKKVSEKLKKLGVKQVSLFCWGPTRKGYEVYAYCEELKPREWGGAAYAAFLISELKEPLKPYMKDIEISDRDDIFNPDFWGNYLISRLTEK